MRWTWCISLALAALSACTALPRDPEGTSARIAREHRFSVAAVDPSLRHDPAVRALVATLERRTGARAQWLSGSGEALLLQLDRGELDLALGRFGKDSPWASAVAFGPPLRRQGQDEAAVEWKAAMRNGENRWILTVESASRAVARGDAIR